VEVRELARAGPFVGDQAGELAGGAAVVGLLGGVLHARPHGGGGAVAVDAARAAQVFEAGGVSPSRPRPNCASDPLVGGAVADAAVRGVDGGAGGGAAVDLGEVLGVVGDGGEVEGARELVARDLSPRAKR
jgi:hypothetical protein